MATAVIPRMQHIIQQKLEAFERLRTEFEASFQFVADVHGQKRFSTFPVFDIVRYLHALWICERKGSLLSVPRTVKAYEGERCLKLLRSWQGDGNTADVIAFLDRKLDMLPLSGITQQLQDARRTARNESLTNRLAHGRMILLNRGMNLLQALDAIFALSEEELLKEVRAACEQYGHLPAQITHQLEEMDSPLYAYVPHPVLAQQNMEIMNKLGVNVTALPADRPGMRTWRVAAAKEPLGPYAEQVIAGYLPLIAPFYNDIRASRFVDRPERSASGMIV
ncbi:hypothetical protein EPA93_42410 [Ktedonosporobacter rubrisoli]|uniref:Uncharacterized protein n=1 Tax=Ktedonosporobacter rubrisoli TaxID=2509675 RepID=A0A4P6K3E6_KTERU|nr:hypothetical protein [Ktedonosporobacter rubrisoli]QBD82280.1 hypothetical protein EPA93_42410 [Ktedonosporobacter rubrisoli]